MYFICKYLGMTVSEDIMKSDTCPTKQAHHGYDSYKYSRIQVCCICDSNNMQCCCQWCAFLKW